MFRYAHVRSNRNSSSHNEVNLASVLVCIVIMFLFCHFPRYQSQCHSDVFIYFVKFSGLFSTVPSLSWPSSASKLSVSSPPPGFSVWRGEETDNDLLSPHTHYCFSFMHWLLIVNSSSNFIIYLFMGQKFKQVLKDKLRR